MAWQVEFYADEAGRYPVGDVLHQLPKDQLGKVLQVLRMLEERGPHLPFPYSSQVEGPLRELRVHYGRALYRILYYGDVTRTFVLLHMLAKRTAKLPLQDILIAKRRMAQDQEMKRKDQ
ncbi:MAG: type II toxin-antitoxin system RelE/ParE family toxin [Acidobacteriia bacterium]|nr:type II toxin-antitoxin system RelE/ParE family toxin [Terriglobia bacterium]